MIDLGHAIECSSLPCLVIFILKSTCWRANTYLFGDIDAIAKNLISSYSLNQMQMPTAMPHLWPSRHLSVVEFV